MYLNGQSRHFIWYTPLLSYLSVFVLCLNVFLIVFYVRKDILSCVSLKIVVTCLTSLPQHVKVARFIFSFCSSCVLYFRDCDGTFSIRFVLYSYLCSMFYMMCISVCFASAVIGYVCIRFNRKLIVESLCSWG
jgi:hypothetical protein